MQTIALTLVLWFIFTIPLENSIVIPGIGTISRASGIVACIAATGAFAFNRRVRRLDVFHLLFFGFVGWGILSYLWAVDPDRSLIKVLTMLQLPPFLWLLWQFIDKKVDVLRALQAFVLGAFVSVFLTFWSYRQGTEVAYLRFSAVGFDPNELSVILSIGIPVAWYLSLQSAGILMKWLNRAYVPLAFVAILLTGSRTGLVAAVLGALFIVTTTLNTSWRARFAAVLVAAVGGIAVMQVIPQSIWNRLATLGKEVHLGTMHGRTVIWQWGIDTWLKDPLLGVGVGSFSSATKLSSGRFAASHNALLSVLVEQGIVGFVMLSGLMLILLVYILKMDGLHKKLYLHVFLVLAVGLLTLSWDVKKPVWLLCGLFLSHMYCMRGESAPGSNVGNPA